MINLQTPYGSLYGLDGEYTITMLGEVICQAANRRRAKANLRRWIKGYQPADLETGMAVMAVASKFEAAL